MKYQSEIIKDLIENNGHHVTTKPHYEVDCINEIINGVRGSYPKLCDYMGEWMNYANEHVDIGKFPTERVVDVTNARFENVVPYGYKSAILKGNTGYRDIDTGEILEAFEEGRNLELVSVKMPVLTTIGKNLFDGEFELDMFLKADGTISPSSNWATTKNYISVRPNTTYTQNIRMNSTIVYVVFYDKNKNIIGTKTGYDVSNYNSASYTTPNNCYYIKTCYNYGSVGNHLFQVEESSTATDYEPYKSNILTVNEPIELRGIGDVQDTLDCLTGEMTQRIGEVVLDGSQSFSKYDDIEGFYTKGFYTVVPNNLLNHITNTSTIICNQIKITTFNNIQPNFGTAIDSEGLCVNSGYIKFRIDGGKASTVEELNTYLSKNPIKILIPFIEPNIKTVDLSCLDENNNPTKFKPYEGVMNVVTSSETLPPLLDMEVPVEAINQNLAGFIK